MASWSEDSLFCAGPLAESGWVDSPGGLAGLGAVAPSPAATRGNGSVGPAASGVFFATGNGRGTPPLAAQAFTAIAASTTRSRELRRITTVVSA
jgi:hypothetical protein